MNEELKQAERVSPKEKVEDVWFDVIRMSEASRDARIADEARLSLLFNDTTGRVDLLDLVNVYRYCQSPLAGDMPKDFHCTAEEAIQKVAQFVENNVMTQTTAMQELAKAGMLTKEKAVEVLLNMSWASSDIGGEFPDILSYDKSQIYELWHECEKALGVKIRRKPDSECNQEVLKFRSYDKFQDKQNMLLTLVELVQNGQGSNVEALFLQDILGLTVGSLESDDDVR